MMLSRSSTNPATRPSAGNQLVPVVLALVMALCVLGPSLLMWSQSMPPYRMKIPPLLARMPRLVNLTALRRSEATQRQCSTGVAYAQIREFFQSEETVMRSGEIITALTQTMVNNPCAQFVMVVSDPAYLRELQRIQGQYDVDMDVWWAPGDVTYDRLFLAAQLTDPRGLYILSTADVVIPDASALFGICPKAFADGSELFAVSRRDLGGLDCTRYASMFSTDVFIGNATMIDDFVLHNTRFSPVYWGIENVVMHVLLRGKKLAYNLCPYFDVVHHHAERSFLSSGEGRVRINHPDNSADGWNFNLSEVCDMKALEQKYPKVDYKEN